MDGKTARRASAPSSSSPSRSPPHRVDRDDDAGRGRQRATAGRSAARRARALPGPRRSRPADADCLQRLGRAAAAGSCAPSADGRAPAATGADAATASWQPRHRRPLPRIDPNAARRADMGGTGVIDHFLEVFTRYIDCGFGLLGGEVAFIATTLIVIDMTLAALFWSLGRRRRHHRAPGQEDAVRRRLRLHHRQLEQPRPHRLRELRRPRPEGVRHRLHRRRSSAARAASRRSASMPAGRCSSRSPA